MSTADTAIQYALQQVGKPYRYGATGPDAFDCSGLVMAAYAAAGIKLPRTTFQQVSVGTPIARANLAPGDLVFPDPGHVQIYLGGNKVVEAPHTGAYVRVMNMWGFWKATRVTATPAQGSIVATNAGWHWIWGTPIPLPIPDSPNDIPGLGPALQAWGALSATLNFLTDTHNWLRMAEFVAGMGILILALVSATHIQDAIRHTKKAANVVGKVANASA